jgi:hypothetical protein
MKGCITGDNRLGAELSTVPVIFNSWCPRRDSGVSARCTDVKLSASGIRTCKLSKAKILAVPVSPDSLFVHLAFGDTGEIDSLSDFCVPDFPAPQKFQDIRIGFR